MIVASNLIHFCLSNYLDTQEKDHLLQQNSQVFQDISFLIERGLENKASFREIINDFFKVIQTHVPFVRGSIFLEQQKYFLQGIGVMFCVEQSQITSIT